MKNVSNEKRVFLREIALNLANQFNEKPVETVARAKVYYSFLTGDYEEKGQTPDPLEAT